MDTFYTIVAMLMLASGLLSLLTTVLLLEKITNFLYTCFLSLAVLGGLVIVFDLGIRVLIILWNKL